MSSSTRSYVKVEEACETLDVEARLLSEVPR